MTCTKKKIVVEMDVPDGATHYSTWSDGTMMVDENNNYFWWMFDGTEWRFWIEIIRKWMDDIPDDLDRLKPIEVIE